MDMPFFCRPASWLRVSATLWQGQRAASRTERTGTWKKNADMLKFFLSGAGRTELRHRSAIHSVAKSPVEDQSRSSAADNFSEKRFIRISGAACRTLRGRGRPCPPATGHIVISGYHKALPFRRGKAYARDMLLLPLEDVPKLKIARGMTREIPLAELAPPAASRHLYDVSNTNRAGL